MGNKKTTEQLLEGTEAGKIWSEIKDKTIEMFALPDQKVHQYCQPKFIDPTRLYLDISASSVLPSLEAAIGNNYTVELATRYVIVSRAVKPLV